MLKKLLKILQVMVITVLMLSSIPMMAYADDTENSTGTSTNETDNDISEDEEESYENATTIEDIQEESDDESEEEEVEESYENATTIEDMQEELDDESEEEEVEEKSSEDELSEGEVRVLKDKIGAQVRLLQLESRVEFQIEAGKLIIEEIGTNTPELEEIISNLEGLKEEIDSTELENKTAEELAEKYVTIKAEAIELTYEFKKIAALMLTLEQKQELRDQIQELRKEWKSEIEDKIKEAKNRYHANKISNLLEKLDVENPDEIIEKVKSGEITMAQVEKRIRAHLKNLDENKKREIALKVKEENQKAKIEAKVKTDELKKEIKEKRDELKEKVQERNSLMKQRIENIQKKETPIKKISPEKIRMNQNETVTIESEDESKEIDN